MLESSRKKFFNKIAQEEWQCGLNAVVNDWKFVLWRTVKINQTFIVERKLSTSQNTDETTASVNFHGVACYR